MRNQKIPGLDNTRLEVMALKSIFHDMVSIAAVACYSFTYPLGASLQDILIMLALHFIFNWKKPTRLLERLLQSVKVADSGLVCIDELDTDKKEKKFSDSEYCNTPCEMKSKSDVQWYTH